MEKKSEKLLKVGANITKIGLATMIAGLPILAAGTLTAQYLASDNAKLLVDLELRRYEAKNPPFNCAYDALNSDRNYQAFVMKHYAEFAAAENAYLDHEISTLRNNPQVMRESDEFARNKMYTFLASVGFIVGGGLLTLGVGIPMLALADRKRRQEVN
jgi:hypothetical protein